MKTLYNKTDDCFSKKVSNSELHSNELRQKADLSLLVKLQASLTVRLLKPRPPDKILHKFNE